MGMRRGPLVVEDPGYDVDFEPSMLTIKMHHGGAVLRSPHIRYIGGVIDCFDYVDGSKLGISELKEYLAECRPQCDKNRTKFYHKCKEEFDKGCRLLKSDKECLGLLKFFKKGDEVHVFVEHADLEDMLRAEFVGGEIRQEYIEDELDYVDGSHGTISLYVRTDVTDYDSDYSENGSSDESEGLVDSEYDIEDDDTLFDLNIDPGVEEEASANVNHTQFFSRRVHDQLNTQNGDRDLNSDNEWLRSDYDDSDGEADIVKLDTYPKFNAATDSRKPAFAVEDYVDDCYSVNTYKAVYKRVIKPMTGPELWPQTCRVAPQPPPMQLKKVGRTRKLRRVNPIEAEDNGRTQVCKVRKYLFKICNGQGHNSRACKKKKIVHEVHQESMNLPINAEESMEVPTFVNMSQASVNTSIASSSQSPMRRPQRSRAVAMPHATPTAGINIRAPPPMVDNFMQNRAFRPLARSRQRPPVIINEGQKFVAVKDLSKDCT